MNAEPEAQSQLADRIKLVLTGCGVLLLIVVGLLIFVPHFLLDARRTPNSEIARYGLRWIASAQQVFRNNDKEGDGLCDYGTLEELAEFGLVDEVLATGTKAGYRFEVHPSPTTPEFLWMATAAPVIPGTTGDVWLAINHEGVTCRSYEGPCPLNDKCEIPKSFTRLGQ